MGQWKLTVATHTHTRPMMSRGPRIVRLADWGDAITNGLFSSSFHRHLHNTLPKCDVPPRKSSAHKEGHVVVVRWRLIRRFILLFCSPSKRQSWHAIRSLPTHPRCLVGPRPGLRYESFTWPNGKLHEVTFLTLVVPVERECQKKVFRIEFPRSPFEPVRPNKRFQDDLDSSTIHDSTNTKSSSRTVQSRYLHSVFTLCKSGLYQSHKPLMACRVVVWLAVQDGKWFCLYPVVNCMGKNL
ncbi:hypothetical protein BJ508DRAFT_391 [Ascobolus immersus RN42]|uniref:Uncharacterized protein n=1 Tax=Ascobolus immersus RN42 TaxID=1160509 RepID=A0A3N4IUI5_ASCIM|nr:hypothetical protein BJ508DRAFT_391 [Ascobolus immersus RN42]